MIDIIPFADDVTAYEADGIGIENGVDRLRIDVRRSFARNRRDLEDLKALRHLIDAAVREIESTPSLPETSPAERPAVVTVKSPFG